MSLSKTFPELIELANRRCHWRDFWLGVAVCGAKQKPFAPPHYTVNSTPFPKINRTAELYSTRLDYAKTYLQKSWPVAVLTCIVVPGNTISVRFLLTSFLRLPNELLLAIAKHPDTARDLAALMPINKRLAIRLDRLLSGILLRASRASREDLSLFDSVRCDVDLLLLRLLRFGVDLDRCLCVCVGSTNYCICMPALHTSITDGNVSMVNSLLRSGASIYATYGTRRYNAIHVAIEATDMHWGHMQIKQEPDLTMLRMLLGGGRLQTMNDPASLDNSGTTWLHHAIRVCQRGYVSLVELFLLDGLSIDVAGELKQTALHVAVLNNRADLTALLLKHGADHRTTDSKGRTPFGSACRRPNCAVVEIFLRHDDTLIDEVVNDMGETAMMRLERKIEEDLQSEDQVSPQHLSNTRTKLALLELMKVLNARRNPVITGAVLSN